MKSETMLLKDKSTLRYSVYLPKGFEAGKSYPLVFALHFGGPVPVKPFYGGSMIEILVAPGLKDLNAIIVAPDSIDGNWGSDKNKGAIEELLDRIHEDFTIDDSKTLLTGFSMGGHGTWAIAAAYPERFRAAIPIAGRGLADEVVKDINWEIPFYVIHSNADTVVPIEPTRKFVEQVQASGADVTFVEVDGLPHFETYRFAKPLADAIPWLEKVWGE